MKKKIRRQKVKLESCHQRDCPRPSSDEVRNVWGYNCTFTRPHNVMSLSTEPTQDFAFVPSLKQKKKSAVLLNLLISEHGGQVYVTLPSQSEGLRFKSWPRVSLIL